MCFRFPDPTYCRFLLKTPKHFTVKCEQNIVKYAEKCSEKCNFYIKYFDKIKCFAGRPYLAFSDLKPETHIYIFWPKLL